MWYHLTPRNLIDAQLDRALRAMGDEVRELQRAGYGVDADRVLDEMAERMDRRLAP